MWLDEVDSREIRIFLRKPRVLAHDSIGGVMDICYFYFIHSFALSSSHPQISLWGSILFPTVSPYGSGEADHTWPGVEWVTKCKPAHHSRWPLWLIQGWTRGRYFWKEAWCREDVVAKPTWPSSYRVAPGSVEERMVWSQMQLCLKSELLLGFYELFLLKWE